jgi:hypothetical protein
MFVSPSRCNELSCGGEAQTSPSLTTATAMCELAHTLRRIKRESAINTLSVQALAAALSANDVKSTFYCCDMTPRQAGRNFSRQIKSQSSWYL